MQDMDAVYRQHFRMVYQYLMSLTHQPDVAEELAQETFCQAVSSIHRYDGSCKITTWLCAIAKNKNASRRLLGVKFWCLILCFLHKQLPKQSNHI